jgi:polyisoprenoid-binding protein YceI
MKKHILLSTALAGILFFSFTPQGTITYRPDLEKSTVGWHAKKVTGEHMGNVKIKSGSIVVDHHTPSRGEFVMDMNSITCTDIKDAGYNAKLVSHLKSDDFFGVEQHPEARLKIKSFTPIAGAKEGNANYTIQADLTIKGKTKEISFPATLNVSDRMITANAEIKIDRTDFDVRYGSGKFFDNLGDKMIYDEFTLKVDLTAFPN